MLIGAASGTVAAGVAIAVPEACYDELGNLQTRTRAMTAETADSTEKFGYDLLDRLTSAETKIPSAASYDVKESYAYDSIGNLTQKGGKTYAYSGCPTGGPHAVCTVGESTGYSYDQNGNMVAGNGRTLSYNSFNKVTSIVGGPDGSSATVDFMYGADGHRVVQLAGATGGGESARTVYVGLGGTGKSIYERTTYVTSGTQEHVHFLYAGGAHGGNAFAVHVVTDDGAPAKNRYNHFDHLGSVTATTDDTGQVFDPTRSGTTPTVLAYDAWGARRSLDGSAASSTSLTSPVGHREFTSHETIPNVGLVNMNGRVYDPELGRFLTPDPTVQFLADLQSYNRYSYTANNPLRYTDPTGYFFGGGFDTFVNVAIAVAGIAVCAYTGGAGCALAFTLAATIYNTTSMVYAGVPLDQAIGIGLFGMGAGVVGGGAGAAFTPAVGLGQASESLAASVTAGAIAGAFSGAMSTLAFGSWKDLGSNVLLGAASGALGAALAWSLQPTNLVSQASAAEQQGGGGGSGADKVAAVETGGAAAGRPGSLTAADLERIVNGDVADGSTVPGLGQRIADIALARSTGDIGEGYGLGAGTWLSPNPDITGNSNPDIMPVPEFAGNKCNLYAGDVLYLGGAEVPVVMQPDGSVHYALAQNFAESTSVDLVPKGDAIQVGDIAVRTVDGISHVEIVTGFDGGQITSVYGAHAGGVGLSPLNTQLYNYAIVVPEVCRDLTGWLPEFHENSVRARSLSWCRYRGARGL
jgi:RHS repeat-associated protein